MNVIDRGNKNAFLGVLSQSDIVKYVGEKELDLLKSLTKERSLKELGFVDPSKPIVKVESHTIVLRALSEMSKKGVTSVAVVDSNEKLLGSISMTDIKYIFKHSRFSRLQMPCGKFLTVILSNEASPHP